MLNSDNVSQLLNFKFEYLTFKTKQNPAFFQCKIVSRTLVLDEKR